MMGVGVGWEWGGGGLEGGYISDVCVRAPQGVMPHICTRNPIFKFEGAFYVILQK